MYLEIFLLLDDSSDGESEWKKERSSCDTLDQSGICEGSTNSLAGRKSGRTARKVAKQAQYKRYIIYLYFLIIVIY